MLHATLSSHKGTVHVARYAKGSAKHVLTGGQDRIVRLWNPQLGTEIKEFKAHGYEVLSISVAHDNSKFVSSGGDRSVFLWDVATGVTSRRIPGHTGKIFVVDLNQDATVCASGSYDATVRLWDLRSQSRQPIQTLDEARDAVQTLHIGPTTIATGSVDGEVRTYDLRKGQLSSDFIGQPVTSIVPSTDLQTLLVTTLDSTVRLLDTATGQVLNTFKGHLNNSYRCRSCFSHDESTIICGDENGALWRWDVLEGKLNPPLQVHAKVITWVEHHPTESGEMITASADGTVKVWHRD